ncbi:MAG: glycoside hydrolase family 9 protein [Ruminococcus sp.]|nr:glycoside hydrolase family 9 protein [Ruminococcus sp.]
MKSTKKILCAAVCAVTAACSVSAPLSVTADDDTSDSTELVDSGLDYDFARALQYSIYFYDANMCGTEVDENNGYSWRGDCHTYDAEIPLQPMDANSIGTNLSQSFIDEYRDVLDPDGDGCVDLAGGFHDAGDHVKFGMPENYSAATLGWGYYEFRDSYVTTGQDEHIETILRYFNDYLMKCTFIDDNGDVIAHCYQVGDGDIDHAYWNAPEIDDMARPAFFLTADKPQTDYVVSAAASLALTYMNFKDTDPEYAEKSLEYAKALYKFANDNPKELSDNSDGPKGYYRSDKWEDDYVWAAAWLFKATEDVSYLEDAMPYVDYYAPSGWCYCWNDVWSGAITLLGEIDLEYPELDLQNMYRTAQGKTIYEDADFWLQIEKAYQTWSTNYTTEGGYAFLNQWGSARYNTAMQFICLVYDKYTNDGQPGEASEWAKSQMQYLMGDNDVVYLERVEANEAAISNGEDPPYSEDETHGSRSFIVGYNDNSAAYPHHRAASGLTKCEDTDEQRYVLYGARVGGPDGQDSHRDVTADYIYNEVTIDYNAAFVGASAGLYAFFGTEDMQPTENFPPAVSSEAGSGGNNFWVDAYAVDDPQTSTSAGVTKLAILMRTDSITPKTDLSMRYYFSIEEFEDKSNIDSLTISELYDQAAVEASPADGVISGPYQYDASFDPNIYYVEVKWDGYKIANSNKKYQFLLGLYYGDTWDPTNDWSYQGITICDSTYNDGSETKTDYICVYSDGVLVGGIEPDGTTVSTEDTSETTTSDSELSVSLWGDANVDGKIDISDAVAIMSYASNSEKYPISDQGLLNADVNENGNGISNMDALAIQKLLANSLSELPESYSS